MFSPSVFSNLVASHGRGGSHNEVEQGATGQALSELPAPWTFGEGISEEGELMILIKYYSDRLLSTTTI